MNFTLSPEVEDYRKRYRAFVAEHVLPLENDPESFDDHENIRLDLLEKLRSAKQRCVGVSLNFSESDRTVGNFSVREIDTVPGVLPTLVG